MIWEIDEGKPKIEGLDAAGRPDPAYAAALGLLRAPFGRRALAFACDAVVWLLLQLPLWIGAVPLLLKLATGSISAYGFLNHPDFVVAAVMAGITVLLSLVYLVVQLILHGRRGVTIGKAIAGIRSVNVRTLERPKVGAVFLRSVLVALSGVLPLLGPAFLLVSPTFDPDRRGRGLHDKATNVWLVDARKGLNPYDEKRMRVARKMVKTEPAPERSELPSLATPVDPSAQPQYRPGSRVSAGVLGVARPHDPRERAEFGLPASSASLRGDAPPAPAAPTPVAAPTPAAAPTPTPTRTPAAAPTPAATARYGLRFDTGENVLVAEPVLLGRNPDAGGHPGARAIPLADDSMSLSKTHMLVRPVDGGIEVVDCRSTNGSGLIRSGTEYTIAPDAPVQAAEGDMLRLGDRIATVVRV